MLSLSLSRSLTGLSVCLSLSLCLFYKLQAPEDISDGGFPGAELSILSASWSKAFPDSALLSQVCPPPTSTLLTGHWRDFLDAIQPSGSKTRCSDPDAIYSAFAIVRPVEIMQPTNSVVHFVLLRLMW